LDNHRNRLIKLELFLNLGTVYLTFFFSDLWWLVFLA
ncbi:hypothetical protein A2U01_0019030, partial [Trifolium medium]|nr:hypothetical protein [Trifolium medium]